MPRYDLVCSNNHEHLNIVHSIHVEHPTCPECGAAQETLWRTYNPSVKGDDIPGGVVINHGLTWPDGSPRRFYSKTEMKRAANEKGLKWSDDTPGVSYRVNWSGVRENAEKD